jgi:hypothetical protein
MEQATVDVEDDDANDEARSGKMERAADVDAMVGAVELAAVDESKAHADALGANVGNEVGVEELAAVDEAEAHAEELDGHVQAGAGAVELAEVYSVDDAMGGEAESDAVGLAAVAEVDARVEEPTPTVAQARSTVEPVLCSQEQECSRHE